MVAVLFVCLGNICRSPAAEGVLRHLVEKTLPEKKIHVESCGIGDWHVGQGADERMREAAELRGVKLTNRAQQFNENFLDQFDFILAADREVLYSLHKYTKNLEHKAKIQLITGFSSVYYNEDIPDPYYSDGHAFDLVLDMLEDSCEGLLQHIKSSE